MGPTLNAFIQGTGLKRYISLYSNVTMLLLQMHLLSILPFFSYPLLLILTKLQFSLLSSSDSRFKYNRIEISFPPHFEISFLMSSRSRGSSSRSVGKRINCEAMSGVCVKWLYRSRKWYFAFDCLLYVSQLQRRHRTILPVSGFTFGWSRMATLTGIIALNATFIILNNWSPPGCEEFKEKWQICMNEWQVHKIDVNVYVKSGFQQNSKNTKFSNNFWN